MTINKVKLTMRKKQALATREKIYSTAFRLITERGFDNITVDEIYSESFARRRVVDDSMNELPNDGKTVGAIQVRMPLRMHSPETWSECNC